MDQGDGSASAGDSRFAAFGYDPRFRRPKPKETSVKLEQRFARVMTDKRFNDLGISSHAKSGFAVEDDKSNSKEAPKESKDAGSASEFDGLESRLELLNMMARGEIDVDGTSSDDSDDDADWAGTGKADTTAQALDAQLLAAEATNAAPDIGEGHSAPQTEDSTARLAIVNLDWDQTRAEDIFALLKSFVPATGRLDRVSVFPSDYGEKMIAQEATLGPKGIWTKDKGVDQGNQARKARLKRLDTAREERQLERLAAQKREEDELNSDNETDADESDDDKDADESDDDEDADESAQEKTEDNDPEDEESEEESDGGDGGFDPEKLRLYELGRLRYYFAEAVFDSAATAAKVYEECDGREFGSTGTVVDLRFIPDGTTFEHKTARDVAASVDAERYEAPQFSTSALRSTNVELSWDAPDPRRERKLRQWISEMREAEVEGKRQRRKKKKLLGMLSQGKAGGVTAEDVALRQEEDLRQFLAPASDDEEDGGREYFDDDDEDQEDDNEDQEDGGDDDEKDEHAPKRLMQGEVHDGLSKSERKRLRKERKAEARRKARLLLSAMYDSEDEDDGQTHSHQLGEANDDSDGVRESTFTPGLAKTLEEKRELRALEQEETPWEAYQRKRKEKKAEKKRLRKEQRTSDHAVGSASRKADSGRKSGGHGSSDLYDDFGPPPGEADDPFFSMENLQLDGPLQATGFTSSGAVAEEAAAAGLRVAGAEELERKRKQQRAERAEKATRAAEEAERQRREKANLELLMMADPGTAEAVAESDTRGFDVRALAQAHKDATGKGGSLTRKRRREEAKKAVEKDTFVVDAADSRFSRVGLDPEMAIDPTNPAFKDTPAMRGFMADNRGRRQRAGSDSTKRKGQMASVEDTKEGAGGSTISGGAALAALVATVKRKAVGAARGIVKGTDHAKMSQVKSATAAAARRARSSSRKNASKRS